MITSPSPAVRRLYREALPPRTLKHMTSLAPVLSATSSRVCIWIMGHATCFRRFDPPPAAGWGAGESRAPVLEGGWAPPTDGEDDGSDGGLGRLALAGQR